MLCNPTFPEANASGSLIKYMPTKQFTPTFQIGVIKVKIHIPLKTFYL